MQTRTIRRNCSRAFGACIAGIVLLFSIDTALAQQQMGQGMMNQGMMNMGQGCPMMPGNMAGGMMGHGKMGGGMMHQGMMDGGMMQGGTMQGGMADGSFVMTPARPLLSVADVTQNLERVLASKANPRLKLGTVAEKDANTIVGEIVTVDGSVVERYEVDRRSWVAMLVP